MKKFLALLLTVAMVFAMAACSAPAAEETKPAEEGTAAPAEETSEQARCLRFRLLPQLQARGRRRLAGAG